MLGVSVNAITIIVCTVIGLFLKKILNERVKTVVMQALGISVFTTGAIDAVNPVSGTTGILIMILSFVIGGLIGSLINIERGFDALGNTFEKAFNKITKKSTVNEDGTKFSDGFIQATMVYCIGAMVIYGSIQAGLGDNKTLYIKSVLDGTFAILMSVKYGISVAFSAIPVFVVQGSIALLASVFGEFIMSADLFRQELSAIGGVFVMMIGINMLEIKNFKIANMLPAILGACYYLIV